MAFSTKKKNLSNSRSKSRTRSRTKSRSRHNMNGGAKITNDRLKMFEGRTLLGQETYSKEKLGTSKNSKEAEEVEEEEEEEEVEAEEAEASVESHPAPPAQLAPNLKSYSKYNSKGRERNRKTGQVLENKVNPFMGWKTSNTPAQKYTKISVTSGFNKNRPKPSPSITENDNSGVFVSRNNSAPPSRSSSRVAETTRNNPNFVIPSNLQSAYNPLTPNKRNSGSYKKSSSHNTPTPINITRLQKMGAVAVLPTRLSSQTSHVNNTSRKTMLIEPPKYAKCEKKSNNNQPSAELRNPKCNYATGKWEPIAPAGNLKGVQTYKTEITQNGREIIKPIPRKR